MADYTYTEPMGGVFQSPSDEMRFLLNDTSPAAPFSVSDSELLYLLQKSNQNLYQAAARAAKRMSTAYSKQSLKAKSVGNLTLGYDYAGAAAAYAALSDDLLNDDGQGAPAGPVFYNAGPGPFYEDQFDNHSSGSGQPYDVFANPNEWPI